MPPSSVTMKQPIGRQLVETFCMGYCAEARARTFLAPSAQSSARSRCLMGSAGELVQNSFTETEKYAKGDSVMAGRSGSAQQMREQRRNTRISTRKSGSDHTQSDEKCRRMLREGAPIPKEGRAERSIKNGRSIVRLFCVVSGTPPWGEPS